MGGSLVAYTPWPLIFPNEWGLGLAMLPMLGTPLATITPVLATIAWIVVFIAVAIWRYQREEF